MMKSRLFGRTDAPLDPDGGETQDRLGIEPYATGLYYFVQGCDTPMTVGLQGEWGSGKTSLMKMVQGSFSSSEEDRKAVITFWFETWQYGAVGGSDSLGMLLLRDLTNQLLRKLKDDPSVYKFREKMGSALRAAMPSMAGMATSMVTRSDLAADAVAAATGALTGGGDGGRSDMRACFEELVEKALATRTGANPRLVVFIDDLDRVPPKLAVRLLEVLKNFMDVRSCVFVVACDYDVVREGVSELMGLGDERGGHRRREKVDAFFHKLFQVQFRMPIGVYKVDQLLREYLEYWLLKRNEPQPSAVGKKRKELRPKDVDTFLLTGSTDANPKGVRAEGWFQLLLGLLHAAVGTNPRAFKRYLNLVELTSCVDHAFGQGGAVRLAHWALGDGDQDSDAKTLRWCMSLFPIVAMQQRWPDVSAALLVGAGLKARPDSPYGDAYMTDFERRLRTIINRWPTGERDEEEIESALQDELFVQQLREIPGLDFFSDDSGPSAQDLRRFARLWFDLLDCGAGRDDRLSDQELDRITAWSERLGQMGAASLRLTGLARLREQCMTVDSRAGDGFCALASHLLDWIATSKPIFVGGKAGDEKVWIWVISGGSAKTLMSFYPKGGELQIRVNATMSYADSWGLTGLNLPGDRLKAALLNLPGGRPGHVQERPSTFWLDFGKGHTATRNELLRDLFATFLLEVERVAHAAHQKPTSNEAPLPATSIRESLQT